MAPRILVIEDDPAILELITYHLKRRRDASAHRRVTAGGRSSSSTPTIRTSSSRLDAPCPRRV